MSHESLYIRLKPKSKEQPHGKIKYSRIRREYVAGAWHEEKPSAGRAQLVEFLRHQRPHDGAYADLQEPIFDIKTASEYKAIQEHEIRRRNAAAQGVVLKDEGFVKEAPIGLPDPSLLAPMEIAPSEPSAIQTNPSAPSLEDLGLEDDGAGEGEDSDDGSQEELFPPSKPNPTPDAPKPEAPKASAKKSK